MADRSQRLLQIKMTKYFQMNKSRLPLFPARFSSALPDLTSSIVLIGTTGPAAQGRGPTREKPW